MLAGPTAVGKTEVALKLADRLDAEIVSADASQVYRQLDIGTAKPTMEERDRTPHHLLDVCAPDESYSAARFFAEAASALKAITARGKTAIVAGGTGLYLKVLREGIFPAPEIAPEVRDEVEEMLRGAGSVSLRDYLQRHDPDTLAAIDAHNPARLRRAVEYHLQTRQSLELSRLASAPEPAPYRFFPVVLVVPRAQLYDRIAVRFDDMLQAGWLLEVEELAATYDFGLPAFRAVGYRELEQVVRKQLTIDEARLRVVARTRRYAKRQLTWFTHQGRWLWISAQKGVTAKIASGLATFADD